jgi:hypothetical protein
METETIANAPRAKPATKGPIGPVGPRGKPAPGRLLGEHATEDEVAAEIGVKVRTLRGMPDGPPYVVLMRKRFYPVDQFRKWLSKRTRAAR